VMLKLADHANDDGECWPAQARIAKACGISRETVNRITTVLESDGKLTITSRPGTSSKYQLHFERLDDAPKGTETHGNALKHQGVTSDHTPLTCDLTSQGGVTSEVTPGVTSDHTNHHRIIREPSTVPNGTGGETAATPAAGPVSAGKPKSDHARAMELLAEKIGKYPDGGAQAKALKAMVDAGATYLQIFDELDRQIEAGVRRPSFLSVQKNVLADLHRTRHPHQPTITIPQNVTIPAPFEMPTLRFGGYIHEGGARHDQ
jgi:DNA-binding transcriptional regulator YhcF (GntR family)